MGVKGLTKLLQQFAPSSIENRAYKSYTGSPLAVDISLIIYQFILAIRNSGRDMTTSTGKMTSHIHGIFYKMMSMLKHNMIPVPVFDGQPPEIKELTLKERKETKRKALEKLEQDDKNLSSDEKKKYLKKSFTMKEVHIQDIKQLLALMGVPFVQAPGEADSQCAALNITGKVDGVVTEDMDILTFGAPVILRDFSNKKKHVRHFNLFKALKEMDITDDQFIDICILLGCDYCPSMKGWGPIEIFKRYKEAGNMTEFIKLVNTYKNENKDSKKAKRVDFPCNFVEKWTITKDYYKKAKVFDPYKVNVKWQRPNYEGLLNYMVKVNEFKESLIVPQLHILMTRWESYNNAQNGGYVLYRPPLSCINKNHDDFFKQRMIKPVS